MSSFILKACSIPKDYYSRGNVTYRQLLEESGINSHLPEFTVPAIAACLERHPELIDACVLECENIRGSGVWYFGESASGEYYVGLVAENMSVERVEKFESRVKACAEYIHRHLLSMLD